MRASVVICTLDRAESLRQVLGALRRQTHADFEVVVVAGPSSDGTDALLAELTAEVRIVRNPERHLSRSRNLGIAAAAGDAIAFLDDDAVPEPRWLEDLVTPLAADAGLAATGGTVLDHTGTRVQWRYLVCHRTGDHDFDRVPPFDGLSGPGADPFLYVPGGNSAFRRDALARVGGFDEEIEYNFDETEVCLRLHDLGLGVAPVDGAVVHHRALPSHLRSAATTVDPFLEVKNRTYFAVSFGDRAAALASTTRHLGRTRAALRDAVRLGRLDPAALPRALGRADAGWHVGLRRGLAAGAGAARRSVRIPAADRAAFLPFPRLHPAGGPRRLAVVGEPDAEALALAAAGHEVHAVVVGPPASPYRVEERDGVWWRSVPAAERWLPEEDDPARLAALERIAAIRGAVRDIDGPEAGEADGGARHAGGAQHGTARALERPDVPLPRDAPARLEDPAAFPIDWEAQARLCLGAPDAEAFVDAVYARLLGREPDAQGRRAMLGAVTGGRPRQDVVADVLRGVEAAGRGADPSMADRLPALSAPEAQAALRAAWLEDDDAAFRAAVTAALAPAGGGPPGAGPAATDTGGPGAPPPADRAAWVRALAGTRAVRERVAGAERLPPPDVFTRVDLAAALDAAAAGSDRRCVEGLFRLLLGRDAGDDGWASAGHRLRGGTPRAEVAVEIAGSEEARRRGSRPDVVAALVSASPAYRRDALRRRVKGRARRLVGR